MESLRQNLSDGLRDLGTPLLGHDVFYGFLQFARHIDGVTLSHRIANSPPEEVRIHTHQEAHFVLVTGGRYVTSAAGAPDRTVLVYNPPGTTHRDHFVGGRGSFFAITIPDHRLADSLESAPLSHPVQLIGQRTRGLATSLLMECSRFSGGSELRAESLVLELLSEACTRPLPAPRGRPNWLALAQEMIRDSSQDNLTIRQIARSVGVHPTHLARVFRAYLGCTPGDLLRNVRLQKASELLLRSALPIAQVALDAGFRDQAQFTKAFRRVYGVPPGAYRSLKGNRRLENVMLHFDKTPSGLLP